MDRTEPSRDCICEAIFLAKEDGSNINVENICVTNGFRSATYYKYIAKRNRKIAKKIEDEKMLSDITYLLPSANIKFYLSAAKDLATGEIVAWNVRQDMKLDLSMDIVPELDEKGLDGYIFHTDQGVHYTSLQFSQFLKSKGGTQSMSRRGKCTDNGPMESFFGHFKDEVDYSHIKTLEEMKILVMEYMIYYNQQRGQWNRKKCHL